MILDENSVIRGAAEANAKFRTFFEQGSTFAGVTALDGTLIEANRLSLESSGYTRQDVIGKKFWDCGWWNRSPELQAEIQEAARIAAGGTIFRREMPYFVADGSVRYVDFILSPITDDSGRVIYLAPTGVDITDRRYNEQINAQLAAIVESSDDAIISKDLNGVITSWNVAAERLFGYTADEIIGCSVTMLIPPERLNEEPSILDRIRRGEPVKHYETVRRRKDGKLLDISIAVSPLRNKQGVIIGASKIARDISDRKRIERALVEADRQKNEFIATLAHELRNPLAPIRNSLNVLKLTQGDPASVTQLHETMERQVNHMVRLVDDLLEISRITTGKIELRMEQLDVAGIIRHAVETSKPLIESRRHRLAVSLPPENLTVAGDAVRLSQIVANLLNNAAKYTEPEGQIWLTASRVGEEAVISVRDSGMGISSEHLPHVLEMFTQADRAKRHSQDGLGIGLALVKRLIEMHGGRVEARSDGEGRGSEFVLRLPLSLAAQSAPQQALPPPVEAQDRPKRKILVVDDNRDAAVTLAMLLKLLGNEVMTAHDGETGLQAFDEFRPALILLDLGMPDMTGFDVARELQKRPHFAGVTLVALTGWGQADDRRRTAEAGFGYHLVKPVTLDAVKAILAEVPTPATV